MPNVLSAAAVAPRTLSDANALPSHVPGTTLYPGSTTFPTGDFGRTKVGTVDDGDYSGFRTATPFIPAYSGTISEVGIFLTVAGTPTCRAMVYADSGGVPGALLGATADVVLSTGARKAYRFGGLSVPVVAGTKYWLAAGFTGSADVWCEALGVGTHSFRAGATAVTPFGVATISGSAGDNSIFAVYAVANETHPGLNPGTGALAATAVISTAGTYPGPTDFPGPTDYPGRGSALAARAA